MYDKGFKYTESMKSRVFLDQMEMAEGLVLLDKGLNPQLKEERDNLVGKLSALSRQMKETPGNEEKKLKELKEEYRRVESQFEDLLIKIRLNDDFQSLVLSQLPREKSKEDGYFTLNEIMNCDYNAKLVVLSACETGSGKMYKGEGVTGLTRAVMYAGTPAVVASPWKVDDIATKELMVYFYRNMLEKNLEKTEALRQAKLELLKNKNYSNPLYWSAFVMYGE
jgi:CHAT domain-containing protein